MFTRSVDMPESHEAASKISPTATVLMPTMNVRMPPGRTAQRLREPAMLIRRPRPWDPVGGTETPEGVAQDRRRFLKKVGLTAGLGTVASVGGYAALRTWLGSDAEVLARGRVEPTLIDRTQRFYPAVRDMRFRYDRDETIEVAAARYTNFYEFSSFKWSWKLVDGFRAVPWTLTVDGLCRNPMKFSIDELLARFAPEVCERQYRHRCVERWAMAIPWTGIPLAALLRAVEPMANASFVKLVSFHRPDEAPQQAGTQYPWPYTEGLSLAEAANDLTFLASGMYGHPLLKQHGAPLRLVVPWKYGYKSIKSIERIELIEYLPNTFWTSLQPGDYPFESNVEPDVPRPWPQHEERMLGSDEMFPTRLYNGYAEQVARLYK